MPRPPRMIKTGGVPLMADLAQSSRQRPSIVPVSSHPAGRPARQAMKADRLPWHRPARD